MATRKGNKTIIVYVRYKVIDREINIDEVKRLLDVPDDKSIKTEFTSGKDFIEKFLLALSGIQQKVGRESKMVLSIEEIN